MPLVRQDVERSLRVLYDVRRLSSGSSNDEEKAIIQQAIAVLEAQLSSGALTDGEGGHGQASLGSQDDSRRSAEFWSRYNKSRRSPVVQDGRTISVLEFASVPPEGLGLNLVAQDAPGSEESRSPSPNGFHSAPPCSVLIDSIEPASVAALDDRLRPGDQLLEVNRHTLVKVSLERARWLLDSAVRQGRVILAIAEKPGGPKRTQRLSSEPALTSFSKRGSLISDLIVHSETVENGDIAEEDEETGDDVIITSSNGMSRRQISKREARLMRERSMTLPTPSRAESQRLRHSGGFKKRDVRMLHMTNSAQGLGVEVTGGKNSPYGDTGIFVTHINAGGVADRMGKLRRGDEILMINGRSLIGMSHAEAHQFLHDLSQGAVQVVVAQAPETWQETNGGILSPTHQRQERRHTATSGELSPSSQTGHSPHRVHPVARTTSAAMESRSGKSPTKLAISRSQSLSSTSSEELARGPARISSTDLFRAVSSHTNGRSPHSLHSRTKTFDHVLGGVSSKTRVSSGSRDSLPDRDEATPLRSAPKETSRLTRVLSAPNVATEINIQENALLNAQFKDKATVNNARSLTQLVAFPNTELVPITPWARFTKPGSLRKASRKQEEDIVLVKDAKGLGFTIVGGRGTQRGDLPIMVKTITADGAAAEDGRLLVGDEILAINGQSLVGCTQQEVKQVFKAVKRGLVRLRIKHRQAKKAYREIAWTLTKVEGEGLGLNFYGRAAAEGKMDSKVDVFVEFLIENSSAALNSQAIRDDQIVSVNGHSLESVTLEEANACFEHLPPGPVEIVLRRLDNRIAGEADKNKQRSLGQRTNSFQESARRLEKSQASSVTVTSDRQGNTLSTERSDFARVGSAKLRPYLAGTGLEPPARLSPDGFSKGLGRRLSPSEGDVPQVQETPAEETSAQAGQQLSDVQEKDMTEHHMQHSSSLMASLSDYLNHSFSSRENSPATKRHDSPAPMVNRDKDTSPLVARTVRRRSMHEQTEEVVISKAGSPVGMGLTIMGGADTTIGYVIVTDVNRSGPAHEVGIEMGDEIVEVNGMPLTGMTNAAVIDLLREVRTTAKLIVGKAAGAKSPKPALTPSPKETTPSASSPSAPRTPKTVTDGSVGGGGGRDSEADAPPLPEISPPGSRPTSAAGGRASSIASPLQGSPIAGRLIHRRSLTSIPSAKDVKEEEESDDSGNDHGVSIVPMPPLRPSRKRTRSTRPVRSPVPSEHHGSNDSGLQNVPVTPIKMAEANEDDEKESYTPLATSPPPILPSAFSGDASPSGESFLSNQETEAKVPTPAAKTPPKVSPKPDRKPSLTYEPNKISPKPQRTQSLKTEPPKVSPKPQRKPSLRADPPKVSPKPERKGSLKMSIPPAIAPYRPSPPGTPSKTSDRRTSSFSSPLVSRASNPSPKIPRKSSLSRMKSSPILGLGSPKKRTSSPEINRQDPVEHRSEYGDVIIGKRSESSLFELQLRKTIAGLGVSTRSGASGVVLVKSAPSGRHGDLRPNDQLVKVNGQDVSGMSSAEADSLLKSLPRGKVTLLVRPMQLLGPEVIEPAKSPPSTPSRIPGSPSYRKRSNSAGKHPSSIAQDAQPVSVAHHDPDEGVINIELDQEAGSLFGIVVEGGIDTPLQYVFVKELEKAKTADANGRLRRGDQIIMLGEECMVGMEAKQVQDVLMVANTKTRIELVVSRKKAEEPTPQQAGKAPATAAEAAESSPKPKPVETSASLPAVVAKEPSTLLAAAAADHKSSPTPVAAAEPEKPLAKYPEAKPTRTPRTSKSAEPKELSSAAVAMPSSPQLPKTPLEALAQTGGTAGSGGDDDETDGPAESVATPVARKLDYEESTTIATDGQHTTQPAAATSPRAGSPPTKTPEESAEKRPAVEDDKPTSPPVTVNVPDGGSSDKPTEEVPTSTTPLVVVVTAVTAPSEAVTPAPMADSGDSDKLRPVPAPRKTSNPSPPARSPRLSKVAESDKSGSASPSTPHNEEKITVTLRKAGGPLGLALVGGSDTDIHSILIKRVVSESAAGRSQKIFMGDRLLSVNGQSLENATKAAAMALLKGCPDEVTLVMSRRKQAMGAPLKSRQGSTLRRMKRSSSRTIGESQATIGDDQSVDIRGSGDTLNRGGSDDEFDKMSLSSTTSEWRQRRKTSSQQTQNMAAMTMTMARRAGIQMSDVKAVELVKGTSGLGFSVDGGKGSGRGDAALIIKSVFAGGPADRSLQIKEGDLLIEVNGKDFTSLSKREAIDFLKALPAGTVRMLICGRGKGK